ncbi:unnamed protein product [Rotaria sp. Silwood2]|nr:unnamed protein product [Rotaria sp. Silwood2]CAF4422585.1 unnamed protein product [Rotaria sp. Silwood2]
MYDDYDCLREKHTGMTQHIESDEIILQKSKSISTEKATVSNIATIVTEIDGNTVPVLLSIICLIISILLSELTMKIMILIFVVLILIVYFTYQKINSTGNWPNVIGTTYHVPFGDVPAMQACLDGHYLLNLNTKLGKPQVYRIWVGPTPVLLLAHPDAVRQFWQQHDETSIERVVHLGWSLLLIMGEGIGFKTYRNRNRINRFFHACFGIKQVKYFETSYEYQIDLVMQRLQSRVIDACDTPLDVSSQFRYLALDAGLDMFLGTKSSRYLSQLHELVDELAVVMLATFNARYVNIPGLRWFIPYTYYLRSKILTLRHKWNNLLRIIMNEYLREDNIEIDADGDSILVRYLRMERIGRKKEITYEELSDTMIEGLLAPSDGIAATVANTLILLALNPEAQIEARERILNRLPPGIEKTVTLTDLDDLDHLDHILLECQRLLPLFVFNVPELTSCKMTLCGVTVPKETMVMYDVQTLNRCEDIWPKPMIFQPERFQLLNEKQRKALHGFGNGRSRRCLGENFVHSLHKLLIARILLAYQLEPVDNERDIDKLSRIRRPFIYVPRVVLKFIPIKN